MLLIIRLFTLAIVFDLSYSLFSLRTVKTKHKGKLIIMAKKVAPETTPETTETATKFTMKELKDAVLQLSNSVTDTGAFEGVSETGGKFFIEVKDLTAFNWVKDLAKQIAENQDRGLPLETKLEKVQAEVDALYTSVKVVDGKAVFDADFNEKVTPLYARIESLKGQIKRRDSKKVETTEAAPTDEKSDGANA